MSLLRIRNLRLSFGGPPLLNGIDLTIEPGERICLVGQNGCGKSSLLKVLENRITPDDGVIERQQGLKVAALAQELPTDFSGTVFDCVAEGLGELGTFMRRFHQLSHELALDTSDKLLEQLESVQHELEVRGGWSMEQQVETVLSRLSLDPDALCEKLSGGMQRRVLLARALVCSPDLLLLDEPTNHLDIQAIEWLEQFLPDFPGTLLFISHDRCFLDKLATRIIDLDRGVITDWPGDYQTYLRRKQEWLATEISHQQLFDKKLAEEERWIRQGIKARRTRNEGRVRALEKMRDERRQRRQTTGKARIQSQDIDASGKLVIEAIDVDYAIAGRALIKGFSTTILRGDKIGIIGPNGVGKTTLLRLLLDELQPQRGSLRRGTRLDIAYFDQRRALLEDDRSVIDNLCDGREFIEVNGQRRHAISYLQDFLFAPERCRTPVRALSGGERNRLLLAKMFSKPANLLVLDEPTNDLDVDTLELLEDLLVEFTGTVLLVSHDRSFLDNVVTGSLVFEADATVNEYVGGYSDWLKQRRSEPARTSNNSKTTARAAPATAKPAGSTAAARLSYKDERELQQLPQTIEELETRLEHLLEQMANADFRKIQASELAEHKERLAKIEIDLQDAYKKWEVLEQQKPA
ncbi:MAG: ATP-binding cassette domain-containing protein [Thiogranum sp.]|nr:ATP-binding cassette domain-containing protein [Thiogranum sp.]